MAVAVAVALRQDGQPRPGGAGVDMTSHTLHGGGGIVLIIHRIIGTRRLKESTCAGKGMVDSFLICTTLG